MPIVNPSSFQGCVPRSGSLQEYFGKNIPQNRENGSFSFLQWLVSAENTSGVRKLSDDIQGVPGKKRGVKMMFETPMCVTVCTADWVCNDPKAPISPAIEFAEFDLETEYHVCDANGAPAALTFDESQFVQYCDLEDGAFLQRKFSEFDFSMFRALDKEMVQLLRTQIDTANEFSYPFMHTNSVTGFRTLADEWMLWISQKISDIGMDIMDYVLFGGKMIQTISHKYKIATASTEGFDLSATRGDIPNMYYDRNFDAVFGDNAIVAIPKKALQLVTWNKFTGNKRFVGELAINSTKVFPLGNGSSITFDFQWRRDIECPAYTYFPSLFAELVKTLPGGCAGDSDGLLVFKDCLPNTTPSC